MLHSCHPASSFRLDITTVGIRQRHKFQRQDSLTDIHEAVLNNCQKSIELAISNGVPVDLADHAGRTPLFYASEQGHHLLVQLLLEHEARHDLVDVHQTSPLWIAAKEGHAAIVLMLLEKGACVNARAHDQTTALYQASYEGHLRCVYYLVRYKACVHSPKNSGASPLFVAARNGHHRIVKHLLKQGADPQCSQEDLRSPLHTACLYNRVRCVRLIFRQNPHHSIEHTDIYGWSQLHFLAKKGAVKTARAFFHHLNMHQKHLDVTQTDCFGNTALHIAVLNRRTKFVRYLRDRGFQLDQSNRFGWTPDHLLDRDQQDSIAKGPLTKRYLQDLLSLHSIRYTSEEEEMREEVENYVRLLISHVEKSNPLFRNTMICSGSFYERTRVGLPDEFDYMVNLSEIERLCHFMDDNEDDPAGYGRLFPLQSDEAREKLSAYLEPVTGCVSSGKVRQQFYQLLTSARAQVIRKETLRQFQHLKFEWTSGDKRCGTAIHAEWYGTQYPCLTIKIDVVPCLTVYSWPRKARIDCPLPEAEFHIIARSPKLDQTFLWRISTSRAELVVFQTLLPEFRSAYLCLKSLRHSTPFHCQIDRITYTADELLTSYMFKTVFLHEIYGHPKRNQWINGGLVHRVMSILKHLHQNMHRGSIQSYFIQDYNVIDQEDYRRLRTFEIKYIDSLRSQVKETIQAMSRRTLRRQTFAGSSSFDEDERIRLRSLSVAVLQ